MMRSFGVPVVFDVTHSLQLPGGLGKATGGQSEYIENMARAGVACGVDAVFMEVHDDPPKAPSDGPNQLPLNRLEKLLAEKTPPEKIVEEAYLSSLSRYPTEAEQHKIVQVLTETKESEKRAVVEDVYWAILSSKEFLFNH